MVLVQIRCSFRNQDISLYHVYMDVNNQVSLCACKHHIPNMIKTGMRLITGILESM